MVYASLAYEGALLEQLAHTPMGSMAAGQLASRIVIPATCAVPELSAAEHPDWQNGARSQQIGAE